MLLGHIWSSLAARQKTQQRSGSCPDLYTSGAACHLDKYSNTVSDRASVAVNEESHAK